MRLRRWLVPALAAVVAATALGAPATGTEGFRYRGRDCIGVAVSTRVEAARADAFVPDPFEVFPLGDDGQAGVVVIAQKCRISVDGSRLRETITSEVGILIQSPDGTPGVHVYMVWELSDNRLLARARRALGGRGAFSEARFSNNDLIQARASFSWPANPHRLQVTTDGEVFPEVFPEQTWWQLGDRGPIRTDFRFSPGQIAFGEGTVRTQPGTPLAQLLGGTRVSDFGFIFALSAIRARVELVSLN